MVMGLPHPFDAVAIIYLVNEYHLIPIHAQASKSAITAFSRF